MPSYVQTLLADVSQVTDFIERVRLVTAPQADIIVLMSMLCIVLPVIGLWVHHGSVSRFSIACATLSVPLVLTIVLLATIGYRGLPDDNCMKYDSGKVVFSLVTFAVVPNDEKSRFGDEELVLLVKAARWADETHQCRLSMSDPKVKKIATEIREQVTRQQGEGGRSGSGVIKIGRAHV